MQSKRSILSSFALIIISALMAVLALGGFRALAFGDESPQTSSPGAVFETAMTPWVLSSHANDGTLADYDAAYRRTYASDAIKQSNGTYHQNVIANIVADDDTFWEGSSGNRCTVDFTFDGPIDFTHIVYGSRLDASLKGFATDFNIYISQAAAGDDWEKIAHGTGEPTSSLCTFDVCPEGDSVTARRVRFEFVHSKQEYPSIRAMRFYRDDPHEGTIDQIWGDYAKTSFAEGFTAASVKTMLERLKSAPGYDVVYAPYVQRALDVAEGRLEYDPTLERSNQASLPADERTSDAIGRWGDVAGYARSTLKFPNNTTNRQATGIWYPAGEVIHIWVSRTNPSDPLPRIHWAQPYGYWASWHGGVTQLAEGENILTVPNYKTVDYKTYDIVAGNVAYIENPYTEDEQQGDVTVYFEGGHHYPVYRLGDDITTYMEELRAHADRIRADRTSDMDVTELVSGHAMMTVRATQADYLYGARGHDAEQSLEVWQDTLRRVYEFEGLAFDEDDEGYYDPRNAHLNENYRVSQVWDLGWMFTAGEHIGVYTGDQAENVLIDALDENGVSRIPGNWGLIHEFGHSIDIPDRTIQETTNNMVANYVSTRDAGIIRNQQDIDRANAMADPAYEVGTKFNENRFNFMPFFLVESYWPGWWGKLENLYRSERVYTDEVAALPKTERFVYLASVAAGYDLGYWYEKWGLNIDADHEAPFTIDGASDGYRRLMDQAHFSGKVAKADAIDGVDGLLPLWYLDAAEYNYIVDHGLDEAVAYSDEVTPKIKRVSLNGDAHSVSIEAMEDAGERHLLFEVYGRARGSEQWRYLGITFGGTFADGTNWNGAEPEYRVRAIDRALHHSNYSEPQGVTTQTAVAMVGNVSYDSLADAIDAALVAPNAVVKVVKDCVAPSIELSQNLTITATEGVNIAGSGAMPIFTVGSGATLTIQGADDAPIVFDGERSKSDTAAIKVVTGGRLTMENVRFTQWESKGQGAAVALVDAGAQAQISDSMFDHNAALDGGAIASRGTLGLTSCTFSANRASDEGGAVRNHSGGIVLVNGCEFMDNTAHSGGGLSTDGLTTVYGGEMTGNAATYGGAIELSVTGGVNSRVLALDDYDGDPLSVHDNEGVVGDGLYVKNMAHVFVGDVALSADEGQTAIDAARGSIVFNADRSTLTSVSANLASANGYLKDFNCDGASHVDGVIEGDQCAFTAQGAWPAGEHRYALDDWGRSAPIITCAAFDGAADWQEHVKIEGETAPKLIYEAAESGEGGCVRAAWGGKIVFHTDGGEIKAGAIDGYAAGAVTYLPTDVVKTGYSFVGWFDNEDLAGTSVRSIAADQEGEKHFWAKWSEGIYWINYRPNGGTLPKDVNVHRTLGETVDLAIPTRDGFDFLGWHESKEFKDAPIERIDADSREGDITLYARWTHGKDKGEVIEAQEPTCTSPGYTITVYRCVDCDEEMAVERTEIPAVGHDFGEWESVDVSAVCGDGSYRERTCKVCGFEETDGLAGANHQWGPWKVDKEATCTTDGSQQRVCERCQAVQSEPIKGAHRFGAPVRSTEGEVAATCELPGHYDLTATCTVCGQTHIVDHEETPALGHSFGEAKVVRQNDCLSQQGEVVERTCTVCGLVDETSKPMEHRWAATPTVDRKATCDEPGQTSVHCEVCGALKDVVELPALGHDFSGGSCLRCGLAGDGDGDGVESGADERLRSVVDDGDAESDGGGGATGGVSGADGAGGAGDAGDAGGDVAGGAGTGAGAGGAAAAGGAGFAGTDNGDDSAAETGGTAPYGAEGGFYGGLAGVGVAAGGSAASMGGAGGETAALPDGQPLIPGAVVDESALEHSCAPEVAALPVGAHIDNRGVTVTETVSFPLIPLMLGIAIPIVCGLGALLVLTLRRRLR